MQDSVIRSIQLAVELIGFGVLILKIGMFTSKMESSILNLIEKHTDLSKDFEEHVRDDKASFKELSSNVVDIKIALGGSKRLKVNE